jgi:hypothetical protein
LNKENDMANGAFLAAVCGHLDVAKQNVQEAYDALKKEINFYQGTIYPENGPAWQEVHDHSQLLRIACGNLQGMLREHLLKTDPRTNTVKVTDEELEAIQALRDGRAYTVPSPINDSGAIYRVYEYQTDALEQDVGIKKGDWVVQHRHPNAGAEGWKNVAGPYKYRKNAEIAMENKIEYHRNKCAGGKQK